MGAIRQDSTTPAWTCDRPDSPLPPETEQVYFDSALNAWVLSRYEDVLLAFRSPNLVPVGANSKKIPGQQQESALFSMREGTLAALSPVQLRTWRDRLAPVIQDAVCRLPEHQPIDLLGDYANPICLAFASLVTNTDPIYGSYFYKIAQAVSAATAEPFDPSLKAESKASEAKLRCHFHSEYETLRDPGFVAIAHTMPGLLGNAWYALLQQPAQWRLLHQEPGLVEAGIEELFRYAGLTRILFRCATEDVVLGRVLIRKGERLILRVVAANHDLDRFAEANRLDVTRRSTGHLTLGAGPHSCVGASLIRMIALAVTAPLLERFGNAALCEPTSWKGGSGFLIPVSLRVLLRRSQT